MACWMRPTPAGVARYQLLVIALVLNPACVCGWPWSAESGASALTKKHATDEMDTETLPIFLKENSVAAVLFYAPWCFYSQQVMPAWDLAAQKLLLHDPPIKLVKIDAHKYSAATDKYGVDGYPTMKLFVDGVTFEFDSHQGRGWQQIVKWVNKHADRDHSLKSSEELDDFLHNNDLNVIGLFPDGQNSTEFIKAGRHFEDILFAEAVGTELSNKLADHLARHASLLCETIQVGVSAQKSLEVDLPREKMQCSSKPRNLQRDDWTDAFSTAVEGKKVTVTRTDKAEGWQQNLQIQCCDDEKEEPANRPKIPIPGIVMFMPHDERFAIYDDDLTEIHKLDAWIQARRTPMLMRMSEETADKIMESGPTRVPIMFLISRDPRPDLEAELKKAAGQLRGRIMMVVAGMSTPIERRLAELAGIEQSETVIAMLEMAAGTPQFNSAKKYRLETKGLTDDKVVQFVADHEQGKLKTWIKSEPEPTGKDKVVDHVTILVGSTFQETVQKPKQDVLVLFFAPWCGHCRKFEPAYRGLAKALEHVKSLTIAKIDATRNEIEGLRIQGFPTIMLFPAGESPKHDMVSYSGNRAVDDMVRWLGDKCSNKFDPSPPAVEVKTDAVTSGLLDPSEEDL